MIGIKLKKMRAERNLTQRELAKLSKVSHVQIAKYEKDKTNPTPRVVGKLASALQVKVDYFLDFDPDKDLVFDEKKYEKKLAETKVLPTPSKIVIQEVINKFLTAHYFENVAKRIL